MKEQPASSLTAIICRLIGLLESVTRLTGTLAIALTLALVAITAAIVVLRYAFNTGSIALQETMTYLHATIFMLGFAWTLRQGGHVRVDIFYRRATARTRAWIDLAGGVLFLLPLCLLIFWLSWDYVLNSWGIHEKSAEGAGLPWVYLLKTLLLIMPSLLLVQGLADILRNLLYALGQDATAAATEQEFL